MTQHTPKQGSTPASPATHHPLARAAAARTVDSQDLLGPQGVLYIRHQNEVYRLQTTRFGKLILTK